MTERETMQTVDEIIQAVFGRKSPYTLDEIAQKFAFDIKIPIAVQDTLTGEPTYTSMPKSRSFMTMNNGDQREQQEGWMRPQRPLHDLRELIAAWQEINYITTDRAYNCENVHCSDPVYESRNVYGSTNCGECESIVYCDGTYNGNHCLACQRSGKINYCIRVDDSNTCTNSYSVICSNKISNSLFIQDCGSLHECIFCSHIRDHEYCIANMQFTQEEYYQLKSQVIDWIFAKK